MKRTFKHLYHTLWLSIVVVALALAVTLTLARVVTPLLAKQRESIERWAGAVLEQPVEIHALAIRWRYFTPVLHGRQVVIWNRKHTQPLAKVDELDLGIDLVDSLLTGHIQLGYLRIAGVQLTVQQTTDGDIRINGINNLLPSTQTTNSAFGFNEFVAWLFARTRIILEDINITWYSKNGKVLPITGLNFTLRNHGDRHLVAGDAALLQKIPSSVAFVIDLNGSVQARDKIDAKIYVNVQDMVLTQWLEEVEWQGYKVKEGVADFQIWAHWQENQFKRIQSLFGFDKLELSTTKDVKKTLVFEPFIGNLFWEPRADKTWVLDTKFENLGFTRWDSLPGFTGLTGYLHATPKEGSLDLASEHAVVDFGRLFKAPLKFDELKGHFIWQQDADGWVVQGTGVGAHNQDVAALADFGFWLPADNSSPVLSLLARVEAYGVTHIGNYLPLTVLKPDLVRWLSTSITHAESGKGTFILQGHLADFPFDDGVGTFLIDADVKDADLNYWKGWPPIENINGELIFAGRRMEINLLTGQVLETPVQNIQAIIPVLKPDVQAVLNVSGDIATDLSQGLAFLQESPLRTKVGGSLQGIDLKGPMQLQLQLAIPLEDGPVALQVQGHVVTQNAALEFPQRDVKLSDLQGVLDFTKDDITAPALTAQLWGKPIKINLTSQPKVQLQINYDGTPFTLLQDPQGWLLKIRNATANGDILIPQQKGQPLRAIFNSIYIDPNATKNLSSWKLSQIPAVNFLARDIRYGNKSFGQVDFQLKPVAGSVEILDLHAGSSASGKLVARGLWHKNGTEFNGVITSQSIAAFLTSLSFPAGIAGAGQIQFKLHWPDAPYNPTFKQMTGNLVLKLKQGQIIDIGASASAKMTFGRLLTSLSLQSLGRRLSGASSTSSQGFEFDEMEGDFTLRGGSAYTTNLFLDGPVAQINLSGRIGLAAQDYDLLLKVTPHVTASIPLVAGLAGGPIIGVAAWAANAIIGSEVQKIAASSYRVTGSWSAPVVKPI